jgi:hypothetical protein
MIKEKPITFHDKTFFADEIDWIEIETHLTKTIDFFIKEGYSLTVEKPPVSPAWRFAPIWFKLKKDDELLTLGLYLNKKTEYLTGTFVNPKQSIFYNQFPINSIGRTLESFDDLSHPFKYLFSKRIALVGLDLT